MLIHPLPYPQPVLPGLLPGMSPYGGLTDNLKITNISNLFSLPGLDVRDGLLHEMQSFFIKTIKNLNNIVQSVV